MITPENVEKLKLITEGPPTLCERKHTTPFTAYTTPIFITTNTQLHHYVSNAQDALAVRCYTHTHKFEHTITFYNKSISLFTDTNSTITGDTDIYEDEPENTPTTSKRARLNNTDIPFVQNEPTPRTSTQTISPSKDKSNIDLTPHRCDLVENLI